MDYEAALVADVQAFAQFLGYPRMTASTFLRTTAWIHLDQLAPSLLRFGFEHLDELSPRDVRNLLGQHSAGKTTKVEIFDDKDLVLADQPPRRLVLEVFAHVAYMGVS